MDRFQGKRLYISPKTAISTAFKHYLDEHISYDFVNYIDKNKIDQDVIRIEILDPSSCDAIIIVSPNHHRQIYQEYSSYIPDEKLFIVTIKGQTYHLQTRYDEPARTSMIETYSKAYDASNQIRQTTVFISKGFIGGNNKYFYLYCFRNNIDCTMVTDNAEQLNELHFHNLPCAKLDTIEGDKIIAEAKNIIFDQGNYTYFYVSPNQITIQLWHGVGLKKMAPHTHITYDYFVSTSDWTNETNFKHIFKAKHFVGYGYPRNDFLLQSGETELDLIGCDQVLYTLVKSQTFSRTIVYMPTTREYLFGNNEQEKLSLLPLDLEYFNNYLKHTNSLLIIKLHPFIMEFFGYDTEKSNLSNIRFHTPQGDIYPILKYTDILISDYSSIIYDFLLLDKPVILFDYDREEYEQNMGGFLFDYQKYTPGISVKTQIDLMQTLDTTDIFNQERKKIRALFYDHLEHLSSRLILDRLNKSYSY